MTDVLGMSKLFSYRKYENLSKNIHAHNNPMAVNEEKDSRYSKFTVDYPEKPTSRQYTYAPFKQYEIKKTFDSSLFEPAVGRWKKFFKVKIDPKIEGNSMTINVAKEFGDVYGLLEQGAKDHMAIEARGAQMTNVQKRVWLQEIRQMIDKQKEQNFEYADELAEEQEEKERHARYEAINRERIERLKAQQAKDKSLTAIAKGVYTKAPLTELSEEHSTKKKTRVIRNGNIEFVEPSAKPKFESVGYRLGGSPRKPMKKEELMLSNSTSEKADGKAETNADSKAEAREEMQEDTGKPKSHNITVIGSKDNADENEVFDPILDATAQADAEAEAEADVEAEAEAEAEADEDAEVDADAEKKAEIETDADVIDVIGRDKLVLPKGATYDQFIEKLSNSKLSKGDSVIGEFIEQNQYVPYAQAIVVNAIKNPKAFQVLQNRTISEYAHDLKTTYHLLVSGKGKGFSSKSGGALNQAEAEALLQTNLTQSMSVVGLDNKMKIYSDALTGNRRMTSFTKQMNLLWNTIRVLEHVDKASGFDEDLVRDKITRRFEKTYGTSRKSSMPSAAEARMKFAAQENLLKASRRKKIAKRR